MGAFFLSNSHPMVYFSIWEMYGFPHKFPTVRENAAKAMAWEKSGKLILILFPQYGCFFFIRFPSYGILQHMGNAWVSHKFPTVWKNATKLVVWGKSGKSITILFPQHGCFFPIRFPSYGILQHMGNSSVPPYISHSMGKCNKTHGVEKLWEIDTHTFPIVWVLFCHQIPILWCTSSYKKYMGFLINFSQYGKMQQNSSYGENLGNQCS